MRITGAFHGIETREDDKGRAYHRLSIEGFRVEIPTPVAAGLLPLLRDFPTGRDITITVAPVWRGNGDHRWLSWTLLGVDLQ